MLQAEKYHSSGESEAKPLRSLDLKARPGKITLICGPNGIGKTSCLKQMAGISYDLENCVKVQALQNESVAWLSHKPEDQLLCEYVDDEWELICEQSKDQRLLQSLYYDFHVESMLEKYITNLSDGERKRLAFLKLIALDRNSYLLDEVFSALDGSYQAVVGKWLGYLLDQGKLVFCFDSNEEVYRALFSKNLHCVRLTQNFQEPGDSLISAQVKGDILLSFDWGQKDVVLHQREALALVGPNACGKTTKLRQIKKKWGEQAFFVPRHAGLLFSTRSVEEEIDLVCRSRSNVKSLKNEIMAKLKSVFSDIDFTSFPGDLSFGQQKVLAFTLAQAYSVNLYLLDEMSVGLDRKCQNYLIKIIEQMLESGAGVICTGQSERVTKIFSNQVYSYEC